MLFRQIIHEDLGCASYLVADREAGVAAVVDPQWDIEPYQRLARLHGVRIGHVLETHNHADHVSGHGRLCRATGATIHVHELAEAFTSAAHGPIDVVVDPVFGPAARAATLALAQGGRLVNLGGLGGDAAELSSAALRGRTASVLGYTNNALTPGQRAEALVSVLEMAAGGALEVDRQTYTLDDVKAAWEMAKASSGIRPVTLLH